VRGTAETNTMNSFFPEGEGSHPLHYDEDGGYITNAQMQFFLNRQRSNEKITKKEEFFKYLEGCKRYNFISDCMEEDPDSAVLVWTPERNSLSFLFPADGMIAQQIDSFLTRGGEEDEFESGETDSNNFGEGLDGKRLF